MSANFFAVRRTFFQRRCNWQIRLRVEGEELRITVGGLAGSYNALRLCQLDCGHCGHCGHCHHCGGAGENRGVRAYGGGRRDGR